MSRVKNSVATRARRKKILKMASGARAGRHRLYKSAKETVKRGLTYAFRDRRQKKREYRRLWIVRINAAVRPLGLTYGEFMHGMKLAAIDIDRKVLADLATVDPVGFGTIVDKAREALSKVAKAPAKAAA